MNYEVVIGLEVHVQLKTKSKAFCGCAVIFGNVPNSQCCPVCLGLPGSLPVLNRVAFEYALKVALALNCRVQEYTKFDRKHYYYPDLPKNFQISQYDLPLAKDGYLDIKIKEATKRVRIKRVHLEEDAGKLIHEQSASLVDYNRAGTPLLEIVSEPDINSPEEAYEYLTSLRAILRYLGVSDCDMEKGSLRCDANISLRLKGDSLLGTKTELKNMNSFKGVREALNYEAQRQSEAIAAGEEIVQQTRLWDPQALKTAVMRSKEEAKDYRYFPEPDLPPFFISAEEIARAQKAIPELPREKLQRFISQYGLSEYDAKILTADKKDADYAEECLQAFPAEDKKLLVNWLVGPLLFEANSRQSSLGELALKSSELIDLIGYLQRQEISNLSAKSVLNEMLSTGRTASEIISKRNLLQISDIKSLELQVEEAIRENPQAVEEFRRGKDNAVMFLVGQVMKKSKGKANPKIVQEMLKGRLK